MSISKKRTAKAVRSDYQQSMELSLGMLEGAAASSYAIRSGDMRGARGRSLSPPVAETDRRSAGNRKVHWKCSYASFLEGCKPHP